jgi:hypothetical protein
MNKEIDERERERWRAENKEIGSSAKATWNNSVSQIPKTAIHQVV